MSAFEDDLEEEDGECGAAPMLNGYVQTRMNRNGGREKSGEWHGGMFGNQ